MGAIFFFYGGYVEGGNKTLLPSLEGTGATSLCLHIQAVSRKKNGYTWNTAYNPTGFRLECGEVPAEIYFDFLAKNAFAERRIMRTNFRHTYSSMFPTKSSARRRVSI